MDISGYGYDETDAMHAHAYLWPSVFLVLQSSLNNHSRRIFDLGCGDGRFAKALSDQKYSVIGCDPSTLGIGLAHKNHPDLHLEVGSTEEDLAGRFGKFQAVTSLEVIEHVYAPRQFVKRIYDLLEPDGLAIISTPYHGYLKNLAMALLGKTDQHYTALWDDGHIKFWSVKTLAQLLTEAGFENIRFLRVGRFPALAKSMIAIARKPK